MSEREQLQNWMRLSTSVFASMVFTLSWGERNACCVKSADGNMQSEVAMTRHRFAFVLCQYLWSDELRSTPAFSLLRS